jgi:hypothetical protein
MSNIQCSQRSPTSTNTEIQYNVGQEEEGGREEVNGLPSSPSQGRNDKESGSVSQAPDWFPHARNGCPARRK